jgi:hypothetical protein
MATAANVNKAKHLSQGDYVDQADVWLMQSDIGQTFGGPLAQNSSSRIPTGAATASSVYGYRTSVGIGGTAGNAQVPVGEPGGAATRQINSNQKTHSWSNQPTSRQVGSGTQISVLGWHNPLFWLLLLVLLIGGFLIFGFDVEMPKVGGFEARGGRKE